MIVRFVKGIDKTQPDVWVSTNLFSTAGRRNDQKKKLKLLVKVLKAHGIKSKIARIKPDGWNGLEASTVFIDHDEANEAFFIMVAANGIEI
jgi:hypothetical protein